MHVKVVISFSIVTALVGFSNEPEMNTIECVPTIDLDPKALVKTTITTS